MSLFKTRIIMSKSLFIVESPAKAKTIGKYLGDDFIVTSSYGHVRDLPESKLSIDINNNYEPQYVVSEDKEKIVAELIETRQRKQKTSISQRMRIVKVKRSLGISAKY
jgi:DNA topoisomerase IA